MTRFLRWYCKKDLVDGIEGDLHELYLRRIKKYGKARSNLLYFLNTLLFFQPFAIRKRSQDTKLNNMDMFRNYIRIAYRSLIKTKTVSLINILGLAIGISSFIMMMAYVLSELSYDKFHTKADRISRVYYSYESSGSTTTVGRAAFPLKNRLLSSYPEVENVVRFHKDNNDAATLRYGDNLFTEEKVMFSDPEVFEVFDFPFLAGNPKEALRSNNSIVMTDLAAKKYFGDENPIGKTVLFENQDQLVVTGLIAKPTHSHMDFEFLIPLELQRQRGIAERGYDFEKDHVWSGAWIYVLLKDPSLMGAFNRRFREDGSDLFGRAKETRVDFYYASTPLLNIHLHSDMIGEMQVNGNINQVYGFAVIAFLILIIACLNFVNLTTAQSTNRIKEIGLRKVMGAHRSSLIWQFITEAIVVTIISTLMGLLLLEAILPIFNDFMNQNISIPYFQQPILIVLFLMGSIVIGGLAGAYPSLYLSKLRPVKTLKGERQHDGGSARLRKSFVVGQFIVSNVLIVGILVIQSQMDFIKDKNLGFNKEQTIVLKHGPKIGDQFDLFQSRMQLLPSVEGVNLGYVAGKDGWVQSYNIEGEVSEVGKSMGLKIVGFDFLDFYGLDMVAGRYFSTSFATDSMQAIVINEAAARKFGWSNEEAIGKRFSWRGRDNMRESRVIGVMRDANFESLYRPIKPSVFRLGFFGDVAIKLDVKDTDQLIASIGEIEETWMNLFPEWPFEFSFLDQEIAGQYEKEERLGQMVQFFALLAIFIACMGLFGLAMFSVKRRTKEIGVRKVLGADELSIIILIMKGFLILVGVGFLISLPAGYYVSDYWLQDFEYRIELSPILFLMAGVISIFVAGAAIISQGLSVAKADPVQTLRHE
ncbi:MAG: ABC transporter permease [Bacteroidota bacterium]